MHTPGRESVLCKAASINNALYGVTCDRWTLQWSENNVIFVTLQIVIIPPYKE